MSLFFLIASLNCITLQESKDIVCRHICRRENYDDGKYNQKSNSCQCYDYLEFPEEKEFHAKYKKSLNNID